MVGFSSHPGTPIHVLMSLILKATSNDAWGPTGTEMSEIARLTFRLVAELFFGTATVLLTSDINKMLANLTFMKSSKYWISG